jgi:protein-S-isoprenylcysteine O-methyltransferase Ste14
MNDARRRPSAIPWPPILFLGALLASTTLHALLPATMAWLPEWGRTTGWALCGLGAGLMLTAMLAFRRHRTTILPTRGADSLIVDAPFNFTRNPIYLSEAVILAGLGLANASLWHLAIAPIFMAAVTRLAIIPEEAHLSARFGAEWEAYAARVRRWL